ncbi:hypothetical protein WKK05_38925 (plasmid) [Nostoc sp. UHCC 0302]|uniref:hypothetical protein n=1 Tax=Nostoc sp. UHCC 0302 TaxID=3134896 RepID=UPI00311CB6B6
MKSTQRPSKLFKQNPQVTDDITVITEPATEKSPTKESTVELTQQEETIDIHAVVKPIAKPVIKQKSQEHSPKDQWRSQPPESNPEEELPPSPCQHIQFIDCDSEVGSIIFECYHCKQGIISEYSGQPVMGEYKGRPSVILAKVKCPNCEQTAIRLQAREVISTTAFPLRVAEGIASPWA